METLQQELDSVEQLITNNRKLIKTNEMLQRLLRNADFKTIVEQGYLREEALRLVSLQAHCSYVKLQDISRAIDGVSHFAMYLAHIERDGKRAEEELATNIAMQTELYAEMEGV